jgi:tRNA(His) 5'-end guanylyltransferase
MKIDSIGERMKNNYEDRSRFYLLRRIPVIIRLDGRAFHTFTKHCEKPFDGEFCIMMDNTCKHLVENIQGCKCGYVQSDEISLLLTDFDTLTTEGWFDYNKSKIESISSSMASVIFNSYDYCKNLIKKNNINIIHYPVFDSRSFNIPKEEVVNYFIWRQKDWIRNSISMLARTIFSSKELHKKNLSQIHDMLHDKGLNWSNIENRYKNGTLILKENDNEIIFENKIIFTNNREIIEKYINI